MLCNYSIIAYIFYILFFYFIYLPLGILYRMQPLYGVQSYYASIVWLYNRAMILGVHCPDLVYDV